MRSPAVLSMPVRISYSRATTMITLRDVGAFPCGKCSFIGYSSVAFGATFPPLADTREGLFRASYYFIYQ